MKLVAFVPNKEDATSWYRAYGPLKEMYRYGVDVYFISKYYWSDIKGCDVVFIQRPMTLDHIKIMMKCKMMGKKIIIDYDDLLTHIPTHNPFIRYMLNNLKLKQSDLTYNVTSCLKLADEVWVSTDYLKEEFSKYNKNVITVPNAHCDYTFSVENKKNCCENVILWRGTQSHVKDLVFLKDAIIDVANSLPNHKFVFTGYNPKFITEKVANATYVEPSIDVIDYFYFLHNLKPKVIMVPLEEDRFNSCKSNVAALEISYTGGVAVAPAIKQWIDFSACYSGPDQFKDTVKCLAVNDDIRLDLNSKIWENVKEKRLLSNINKLRVERLKC